MKEGFPQPRETRWDDEDEAKADYERTLKLRKPNKPNEDLIPPDSDLKGEEKELKYGFNSRLKWFTPIPRSSIEHIVGELYDAYKFHPLGNFEKLNWLPEEPSFYITVEIYKDKATLVFSYHEGPEEYDFNEHESELELNSNITRVDVINFIYYEYRDLFRVDRN